MTVALGSGLSAEVITLESAVLGEEVASGSTLPEALAALKASLKALPACLAVSPDVSVAFPLTFLPVV